MKRSPLVSVLLPFRDEEAFLDAALGSLARQSLADVEVLCLDDGSRDASAHIVRRWSRRDPRFRWIPLEPGGIVHALNVGIALARGPFLARADADDISHPRRLERQVKFLQEHPDIGVAGCLVRGFPASAVREGYRHYLRWLNSLVDPSEICREIFVESPLAHPTVLIRGEVFQRVGLYRDLNGPEDYDLWLRCFEAGIGMAKVPEILYFWRERPERLSRRDPRYHRSRFWELKIPYLVSYLHGREDLRGRPLFVWGHRLAGRLARGLMAGGHSIKGFININPAKVGGTRLGLPIHSPEILRERPGAFVICAVSTRGAREEIRLLCRHMGLLEGRDFLMAG